MRRGAAAVLCYKRSRGQVFGTRTDAGPRDGLHATQSSYEPVLNAEPGRPQHPDLHAQPSRFHDAGLQRHFFDMKYHADLLRHCTIVWLHGTEVERRPVLRSTCSRRVTTCVGKPSTTSQPTRPTQPFILSVLINEL